MSEQDYEVIVSSTQHKQFLSLQSELAQLQSELTRTQLLQTEQQATIRSYQQQIYIQTEEIKFLQTLIDQLGSQKQKQQDIDVSLIKSNLFEVLGESLLYQQHHAELDRLDQQKQIYTKFQHQLQKAQQITDRLESQEELITKLNQVNTQNNVLLANRNPDELFKELQRDCQIRFAGIDDLKKFIKEDSKIKQQNFNLETKNKLNEEELKKIREDLRKLTPLLAQNNEKIKSLETEKAEILKKTAVVETDKAELKKQNLLLEAEKENLLKQHALLEAEKAQLHKQLAQLEGEKTQLQKQHTFLQAEKTTLKKLNSQLEIEKTQLLKQLPKLQQQQQEPESKGDKSYRIKLLIDQHIKEIEASLRNVGGLTQLQIAGLVESQLKDIIAYVPKSIAGSKK